MERLKPDKVRALLANKNTRLDVFPHNDTKYKSALSTAVWNFCMSRNCDRYEAMDCIKEFLDDKRCTSMIINHKWGGDTALMWAVKEHNVDVVKILAKNIFTDFKSVDYYGE